MTTWEHASSRLGKISDKAYYIAYEIWHEAQAAGHDVWFMWGDGATPDHNKNKEGKPVLDFMVKTEPAGDFVRDYAWEHRERLGLRHFIWERHITSTVVQPGVRRLMADRGDPTANHYDHGHGEWFGGGYVPKPVPVVDKPKFDPKIRLVEDGELGPKTISKWQWVMGTPVDGVITKPDSMLVRAVQRKLKATVDHTLQVDGDWGRRTTLALQRYLKSPVDGFISTPRSQVILALQRRLNESRF